MNPRVLLLSAYDARSHRLWREQLANMFPLLEWQQLALPPRHFDWRIRGNSLQWAFGEREILAGHYDLLIATSMVDLASLRGFIPGLAGLPTLLYFHENQFAYPLSQRRQDNVEPMLVPIYSALCADRIVFNSEYNRRTFLEGARSLIQRLPDRLPDSIMAKLEASRVLPVPVVTARGAHPTKEHADELEVVWNHRWEYDKGVDVLAALVQRVVEQGLPVRFHIVGERFREQPAAFDRIAALLQEQASARGMAAGHFGFVERDADYRALLARCDVVLSTALHDFQGLALQEACLAGCTPLAPDDLVYPEYLDRRFLYTRHRDPGATVAEIGERLLGWQREKAAARPLPRADLAAYRAESLTARYHSLFAELLGNEGA